jgi:dTDP-4-dehydrorhamnose reductase
MREVVLVAGSNGLVGQKTISLLVDNGYTVVAASRGADRNVRADGYAYHAVALEDALQVQALLRAVQPQVVVHAAGMTLPDACERDPDACRLHNVVATANVAEACRETGSRLVYLSTDFVFDGNKGPYRETDAPNPLNAYGRAKLQAEQAIAATTGLHWTVLRTILVYGYAAGVSRSNLVLWVLQNLREQKPIRVVADQLRMPTLAEDLADGILRAIQRRAQGIYHISGGEMLSVHTIAQRVAQFWDLDESLISPVQTAALNEAARRPLVTGFVLEKSHRELGYTPRPLQEGFALLAQQLNY